MLYTSNTQMGLLRRHVTASAIALLLFVLLFTYNLKLTLASSGGVMGGSFFDSDSSSSSNSYTSSDSETRTTPHYTPPPDAEVASGSHGGGGHTMFLVFVFGMFLVAFCNNNNGNSVTVLKLQVAMLGGKGSTIQGDLTRIAETADTSSPEGVSCLLTETIQTLDRNPVAGYLSVDQKRSKEEGEKCYKQLSNEERAKFDEETLVNLNNVGKKSTRSQSDDGFGDEYTKDVKENTKEQQKFEEEKLLSGFDDKYIVITILVAVKGAYKLPNINGAEDLKKALQNIGSLLSTKLLAGEVLWTPQNEDDTLSKRKLIEDYPQLANCIGRFLAKKRE